ncbi:MAG: DUF1844 domain-containing protein [Candidatus Omnitrophica bacterium]|nr:DUF1844 domain-containing protein [Candidatus Omnitrophota bacterium]
MEDDKFIDESWKDSVSKEKEIPAEETEKDVPFEINFLNYITSLGFQALIFLGEIPHPMTNQKEENIPQAKFLIDTLVMIREKTKGNLEEKEENLLDASIYELQIKFLEVSKAKRILERE